jgi:hypothetical protein
VESSRALGEFLRTQHTDTGNHSGEETPALTSFRSRDILGALDILVDIGVFAEKEVIQ